MGVSTAKGWAFGLALAATLSLSLGVQATPGSDLSQRVGVAISEYLRARITHAGANIDLPPLTDFGVAGVSPEAVDIEVRSGHRGPFLGRVPVTVVLRRNGQELKRGVVSAQVRVDVNVPIVAARMTRGDIVEREHIRFERRDLAGLETRPLRSADDLLGKEVVRSLRPGTVWQPRFVERVPIVRRGDRVPMRVVQGALRIDAVGLAREDGHEGDWIRLVNTASRREVQGQVMADGVVNVSF